MNKQNWPLLKKENIYIISLFRDPIDYLLSYYNFIKGLEKMQTDVMSKKIMKLFNISNNFEEFIEHDIIHNGQCKYLLNRYLDKNINFKDIKIIFDAMDQKIIYFGITNNFNTSIEYFNTILNQKIFEKNITKQNIKKKKYIERKDLSKKTIQKLKKKNNLDYLVFNKIKNILLRENGGVIE